MKMRRFLAAAVVFVLAAAGGHAKAALWQDFLDPETRTVVGSLHVPTDGFPSGANCNGGNPACNLPDFHFTYASGGFSWDSETAPNFDIGWVIDPSDWLLDNFSGFILSDTSPPLTLSHISTSSDGALLEFAIFGESTAEVLAVPHHIPIPAALPLFLTALAGLGYVARRKRAA